MRLSLVIPVFNEAETAGLFIEKVTQVFDKQTSISLDFVFVNDGSTDTTLRTLLEFQKQDSRIKTIDLSRNSGKEAALTVE